MMYDTNCRQRSGALRPPVPPHPLQGKSPPSACLHTSRWHHLPSISTPPAALDPAPWPKYGPIQRASLGKQTNTLSPNRGANSSFPRHCSGKRLLHLSTPHTPCHVHRSSRTSPPTNLYRGPRRHFLALPEEGHRWREPAPNHSFLVHVYLRQGWCARNSLDTADLRAVVLMKPAGAVNAEAEAATHARRARRSMVVCRRTKFVTKLARRGSPWGQTQFFGLGSFELISSMRDEDGLLPELSKSLKK